MNQQKKQPTGPLVNYAKSLMDPFSSSVTQPKIYDGKTLRSAGVRFRSTGEITVTGGVFYMVLAPALTSPMTWYFKDSAGVPQAASPFEMFDHVTNPEQRAVIDKLRTVGVGLKLNLMNSADQNEGYWEAARFNTSHEDFVLIGDATGRAFHKDLQSGMPIELSNEPTYQRGKLRDIHRYMYRLNSNNTDHNLGKISAAETLSQVVDEDWDLVIIKIHGRVDSTTPSVINYEIVNNQEVVYKAGTSLARLMTPSPFIEQTPIIMGKIKVAMPALQIQ